MSPKCTGTSFITPSLDFLFPWIPVITLFDLWVTDSDRWSRKFLEIILVEDPLSRIISTVYPFTEPLQIMGVLLITVCHAVSSFLSFGLRGRRGVNAFLNSFL